MRGSCSRCIPTAQSLATAEPAISLGLLGTSAQAWLGDPIATFNFALSALTWIAAIAMCALVTSWTRSRAAALVAALLYAFHALRISDASHVYVYDTGWIVLALFFASRLFESGADAMRSRSRIAASCRWLRASIRRSRPTTSV